MDDSRGPTWEEEADQALQAALEGVFVDDLRRTVELTSSDPGNTVEFESHDDLLHHLAEVYDEAWYAYVPFEGGEAVFESDSYGAASDALADNQLVEFFDQVSDPKGADPILTSAELLPSAKDSRLFRMELVDAGAELAQHFAKNPEMLREIDPRQFEQIMAAVFRNRGFDVTLTRPTRDGGFDLMLLKRTDIGAGMTLVECKRYAEHRKVGVDVVRGLYGVVEEKRATGGLIATTSSFTSDAIAERDRLKYRMELADMNRLKELLREWRA